MGFHRIPLAAREQSGGRSRETSEAVAALVRVNGSEDPGQAVGCEEQSDRLF